MPFALETYDKDVHARALRPGLRLDPMDGQGAEISDDETDATIRAILTEEARPGPVPRGPARRRALPEIAPQEELSPTKRRARPWRSEDRTSRPASRMAPEASPDEVREPAVKAAEAPEAHPGIYADPLDMTGDAVAREGEKSDRRWLKPAILGAVAAAAILRPWLVLLPLFLGFWAVMLFVAFLGGGSFGDGFGRVYRWMKARNPARAERMRSRMDRLAMRVDDLIDRVPGGKLDALALPDFSDAALDPQVGEGRPDPFSRLAG